VLNDLECLVKICHGYLLALYDFRSHVEVDRHVLSFWHIALVVHQQIKVGGLSEGQREHRSIFHLYVTLGSDTTGSYVSVKLSHGMTSVPNDTQSLITDLYRESA
jgi:hypothetical protein